MLSGELHFARCCQIINCEQSTAKINADPKLVTMNSQNKQKQKREWIKVSSKIKVDKSGRLWKKKQPFGDAFISSKKNKSKAPVVDCHMKKQKRKTKNNIVR